MSLFRMFVKDATDLANRPVANFPLLSGQFGEDTMNIYTSRFTAENVPTNIEAGDFVGVYDQFGRVIYNGIISQIKGNDIETKAMLSLYDFEWPQKPAPNTDVTIEDQLATIADDALNQNLGISLLIKNAMTITTSSSTSGGRVVPYAQIGIRDREQLLSRLRNTFEGYGVYFYFTLPSGTGNLALDIGKTNHAKVVIGDNCAAILNVDEGEEETPTNVLREIFYYSDGSLWSLGSHTLQKDGTYTSFPNTPALLFHQIKVKTMEFKDGQYTVPFSDDLPIYLPPLIYNHNISFDMLLDNNLYDFYDWQLNQPMEVWKNGKYYETVFTRWEMSFQNGGAPSIVRITCGTARRTLTEVLNNATK